MTIAATTRPINSYCVHVVPAVGVESSVDILLCMNDQYYVNRRAITNTNAPVRYSFTASFCHYVPASN